MTKVFKFPFTPVSLSLCNNNGIINKTPMSALMSYIEAKINSTPPNQIDATIIDASFFMHLHVSLPATFGGVAIYLLQRVLAAQGDVIHFVTEK